MTVHASHTRPDLRYRRIKRTSETTTIQTGRFPHQRARLNSAGVSAIIADSSQNARPAVPAALTEMSRLAKDVRFRNQTSKFIAARVRHADAIMDQIMVTKFIVRLISENIITMAPRHGMHSLIL